MEVKISIDCTPEEARRFFGLPDVTSLNDAVIDKMKNQMDDYLDSSVGSEIMKTWLTNSAGMGNTMAELQKAFFASMSGKMQQK